MQASERHVPNEHIATDSAAQRTLQATRLLREALALLVIDSALLNSHASRPVHDRLIRLPEVQRLTGLRRSAIYEQMQRSAFPRTIKAGKRIATWSETAVQAWIADRINGRGT